MFGKVLAKILDVICIIIIIFALVILVSVVLTRSEAAPKVLGYSAFRVVSGSMEPEISINSLVLVESVEPEEVEIGDVITFYSSDPALGGAVNTHRVVEISTSGGYVFTTKGDANLIVDQYPVAASQLIGRVVFHSAFLGTLIRLLQNPLVFVVIVAIPLLILIINNIRTVVKTARAVEADEEEKALEQALEEVRRLRAEKEAAESDNQPDQDENIS